MDNKLILLKLNDNSDKAKAIRVTLKVGDINSWLSETETASLPTETKVFEFYCQWQKSYQDLPKAFLRLDAPKQQVTQKSTFLDCRNAVKVLSHHLNDWLKSSESFCQLKERLLAKLDQSDKILVIIQTEDKELRQLPWNLWDLFKLYPHAWLAFSSNTHHQPSKTYHSTQPVRILGILGNRKGIDVTADRCFLENLPGVEQPVFLDEPNQKDINDQLWEQHWDIIYFAGHSRSKGQSGWIDINSRESLQIEDLKDGLEKAIARGLRLAIFNSCDGLGLAHQLETLNLPHIIVMREPVPDYFAQQFVKYFLAAFAGTNAGKPLPLHLAVRDACERLRGDGIENEFPGVTGLPVVCQHSAEGWLTWQDLGGIYPQPTSIPFCPYQGLSAFREKDARFFFGREAFATQLVRAVKRKPLVAAIGPSGIGKSSAVFAGLVPRLRQESGVKIVDFRPGPSPFDTLATAFAAVLPDSQQSKINGLRDNERALQNLIEAIVTEDCTQSDRHSRHSNCYPTRLVLIVDQFEELYTLCQNKSQRQKFLDSLLAALNAPAFTLVLTLRADFFSQALDYRPFRDALQRYASELIGPMSPQELQDAIEKPAAKLGIQLEDGLTQRILNEISDLRRQLPLVQFALTRLWAQQSYQLLTHQAYEQIGGVEKSLADYAESVYAKLSEIDRDRTQQIFIQLVHPGEGTEDIRRLATRSEVGEDNWDLITRLASARLVVTGHSTFNVDIAVNTTLEETVEIVHEALIRGWGRLGEWMRTDRAFRCWQEGLRSAMRQWQSNHQQEGYLLREAPLIEAENWRQQREDISPSEIEYIQASLELRDREKLEKLQTQMALEAAKIANQKLQEANRIIRQGITMFATSSFLAISVAAFAFITIKNLNYEKQEIKIKLEIIEADLSLKVQENKNNRVIEKYQDALDNARKINNSDLEAQTLENIGRLYDIDGQFETALIYYQQALNLWYSVKDQDKIIEILLAMARNYKVLGQSQTAIDYYNRLLAIVREIDNQQLETKTLLNLGQAYFNLGETQKALSLHQQALTLAQKLGNPEHEANALKNISLAYFALNNEIKGREYFLKAEKLQTQTSSGMSRGRANFFCGTDNDGTPVTLASHPTRGNIVIIRYISNYYNITTLSRCQEISAKFQLYQSTGVLNYLVSGKINNTPAICASDLPTSETEGCKWVLFKLKPEQKPNEIIKIISDLNTGISDTPLEL